MHCDRCRRAGHFILLNLNGIADVKGAGDSKISLILDTSIFEEGFTVGHIDSNVLEAIGGDDYEQLESGGTIDAQVRLVPPHVAAFTLAYFTGSKEHNIAMRQRSVQEGWYTAVHPVAWI